MRFFALCNDLFLFGLLVLLLPLPIEQTGRITLGLSLFLVLEVFWGKTPGSLLAGFGTDLNSLSGFGRLLWLGICVLRLLCFGLSFAVGWGVLQVTELFNKEVFSDWNQPVLLAMALSLVLICSVLGSNMLGYLLIEHLEERLSIERERFTYAKEWGLFLSFLPIIGFISFVVYYPSSPPRKGSINAVKANMHTLETMLETYASDWHGIYPESLQTLEREAKQNKNPYWREMVNPFTGQLGSENSFMNENNLPQDGFERQGMVSFEVPADRFYRQYFIYGYDKIGGKIKDKGQIFVLTNS